MPDLDWIIAGRITLAIAVWGAITGTIAVWLEIRRFRKDRPDLLVKPVWETWFNERYPVSVTLKAAVVNRGHRPTTITAGFLVFPGRPTWRIWRWIKGDRRYFRAGKRHSPITLSEGQTTEIHVPKEVVKEPFTMADVRRLGVRDATGREWLSNRRFRQDKIAEYLLGDIVEEYSEGGAQRNGIVQLVRYRDRHALFVREKIGSKGRTKFIRSEDASEARSKFKKAKDEIARIANGESEGFLEGFS